MNVPVLVFVNPPLDVQKFVDPLDATVAGQLIFGIGAHAGSIQIANLLKSATIGRVKRMYQIFRRGPMRCSNLQNVLTFKMF